MNTRTMVVTGVTAAVLLVAAGVGLADGPDPLASDPSAPTMAPTDTGVDARTGSRSVDAAPAGTVQYTFDGVLTLGGVDTAPGWTARVEDVEARKIEVVFTDGARRIDVEVEIEHGAPRERVRDRTGRNGSAYPRDERSDERSRYDDSGRGCEDRDRSDDGSRHDDHDDGRGGFDDSGDE